MSISQQLWGSGDGEKRGVISGFGSGGRRGPCLPGEAPRVLTGAVSDFQVSRFAAQKNARQRFPRCWRERHGLCEEPAHHVRHVTLSCLILTQTKWRGDV